MKSLRRRRLLVSGLGLGLLPSIAAAAQALSAPIGADGFARGALKGFAIGNVANVDWRYFDALAGTGANVARVFFPFRHDRNCRCFVRSGEDVAALRRLLGWARNRGIRLVVAGGFAGTEQAAFWSDQPLRQSFVDSWAWFARTFGNDPGIAGLDLLNEPNPPAADGDLARTAIVWQPLAEQAIAAIRGQGVTLPVIYECVAGAGALGLRDQKPLADRQVVYSIHQYLPHEITHQHVAPQWSRTIPYPACKEWGLGGGDAELGVTSYDRQRLEADLRFAIAFQRRYAVPIYVGEFSCVRWAPAGSRQRYIEDCLAIFRQYGWSWTYHEFRGWPGWDAEIESGNPAATARVSDAPVMKLLRAEIAGRAADNRGGPPP